MKKYLIILALLLSSVPTRASDYVYFSFEPDIITNYIAVKKKLGYVRLTVDLMIEGSSNLEVVEHHSPLLRDAIIEIIGTQPENKVKSITGRQEILKLCEDEVKKLLKKETGQPIIKKLLFTQWLEK